MSSAPFGFPVRPGSDPTPEALDAVVRRGRRRLRHQAAWSSALVVVAGLALGEALAQPGGDEPEVLVPASPPPEMPATPAPFPRPTATADPVGTGSAPVPAPTADASSPGARTPGPSASAVAQAAPRANGSAVPTPQPTRRATTPYRETPQVLLLAAECPVANVLTGTQPGTELCLTVSTTDRTVRAGQETTVDLRLCNSLSSEYSARLTYAGGREHDLGVGEGGADVWTWSRRHTFPQGPHSRELEVGSCLVWRTTWDTRDDEGRLVPPGRYVMVPSTEVNGRTESIRVSIEVTR